MARGLIKKYISERGFGFITLAESSDGADIFFHIRSVIGDYLPDAGDQVEYELSYDKLGRPTATKVVNALHRAAAE